MHPNIAATRSRWIMGTTRFERSRERRPVKRTLQKKKPLAEPLVIAPAEERRAALKEGKMVFYDGKQRLALELVEHVGPHPLVLQGLYKIGPNDFVALRSDLKTSQLQGIFPERVIFNHAGSVFDSYAIGNASKHPDLGHMAIRDEYRGTGLGLKLASKAERHVRSTRFGKHSFDTDHKFLKLFGKLGYGIDALHGGDYGLPLVSKRGKIQGKDNLHEFHRIEAIDPRNGKARIFTFPINIR